MVEFQELIIERFMSYRKRQKIVLANQGVIRIEGPNMIGKSAIIEALCWALYGKTLRGLKHDQVVYRFHGKKDCCVEVCFRVQKLHYTVRRFRKHRVHSNKTLLYCEGRPLAYRHDVDTQQAIESILGFDFSAFINSTVFGGMEGGRKSFGLLTDAERKRILDSFLRFDKFEEALERTKRLRVTMEGRLREADNEIRDLSGLLAGTKSNLVFMLQSIQEHRRSERKQISILKRRLKRFRLPGEVPVKRLERLEAQVQEKTILLGGYEETISRCQESLAKLKSQLHKRRRLIGQDCPTCGQKIAEGAVESFHQHISREKAGWKEKLASAIQAAEKIKREVAYGRSKVKRLQHQQAELLREKDRKRELLNGLRELELTPGNSLFPIRRDSLQIQYSKGLSKLLVLQQKKAQLEKSVKDYRFWEEGFGNRGVKALIVREILPALNRRLAKYSGEIFNDGTTLELSATQETKTGEDRELLNLQYKSPSGADNYIGESSGGRRRADLCVLLVFSWLARASNVLFVDEFFDHLDAAGRERALAILQEQRGSVFVVTHEPRLKSQLSKVWRVVKEGRDSRVEFNP